MTLYLSILVSVLVGATAVALVAARGLFALMVLLSVYSGLFMVVLVLLGAVDVAFTEAVVGAGISTGFVLALLRSLRVPAISATHPEAAEGPGLHRRLTGLLAAAALASVMLYAVHALPEFGDPAAPAHTHVAAQYISRAMADTHTPNVVTAVLADYRSFDTLIETAVVLTGALACLLILRRSREAGDV